MTAPMIPLGIMASARVASAPLGPFTYARSGSATALGQYSPAGNTLVLNNIDLYGKTTRAWVEANVGAGWYMIKTEEDGTQFQELLIVNITYATDTFAVELASNFSLGWTDKKFDFRAP